MPGRDWRCKNRKCGKEAPADETGAIPKDWFGVRKYPGNREDRAENVGVFCSAGCILVGLEQMARDGLI